jgi:RecB family endonuclease NucS
MKKGTYMISEREMEDAIVLDPTKYIGEEGLRLTARQYSIGAYRFDLLFEDRHGGKLIVELQIGVLDRIHMFKILDYCDEYRDLHPSEFVEPMVIANIIPPERKRRLSHSGIPFREIPETEFISAFPQLKPVLRTSLSPARNSLQLLSCLKK